MIPILRTTLYVSAAIDTDCESLALNPIMKREMVLRAADMVQHTKGTMEAIVMKRSHETNRYVLQVLWSILTVLFPAVLYAAEQLPPYNIDVSQTSLSGVSSGGYMAVQFHVAHSSIVRGVG